MKKTIFFYSMLLGVFFGTRVFCTEKKTRDPFFFSRTTEKKIKKKEPFHIIGVVTYKKAQGILVQDGDKQRTLVLGDKINGYTLCSIVADYVEFSKNNKTKRVAIR